LRKIRSGFVCACVPICGRENYWTAITAGTLSG